MTLDILRLGVTMDLLHKMAKEERARRVAKPRPRRRPYPSLRNPGKLIRAGGRSSDHTVADRAIRPT